MAKSMSNPAPSYHNKKARFRFEILDKFECGLVLTGTEVKSLREGRASLDEAYARITNNEVWLVGFHISPYEHGNVYNHDPLRPRKLLLHGSEIRKLVPKVTQRGQTLVPLRVYFNHRGLAKVTLALARGKSVHDKRQDMRKRDDAREMQRVWRRNR